MQEVSKIQEEKADNKVQVVLKEMLKVQVALEEKLKVQIAQKSQEAQIS